MDKRMRFALPFVLAILAVMGVLVACDEKEQPVPLGTTHLSGLSVSGNETDELIVDQTSTGDIVELRDNGTVVWRVADGGLVSYLGQCIDLDADGDTSICADTDDQIDLEIGGADVIVLEDFGATTITTDTTTHLFEVLDTTNVMTGGTNILSAINVDLGIGNSTGGTNVVNALRIDSITQDASNTETAIYIGTGWDVGFDVHSASDISDTLTLSKGTGNAGVVSAGGTFSVAGSLNLVPTTPATSTEACTIGKITADTGYIYVCTATDTWERVAIASW